MKPIVAVRDLDEGRSCPRALVILWVNWSVHARKSHHVVQELATAWNVARPEQTASVYLADLSDQHGEVWDAIRCWLEVEGRPVDQLTFGGGGGALLWVRDGKVVADVVHAAYYELAALRAMPDGVFGADDEPR